MHRGDLFHSSKKMLQIILIKKEISIEYLHIEIEDLSFEFSSSFQNKKGD